MGKIKKILENELVGGTQSTDVYPVTSVKAVYDENNERLDHILNRRGVVNVSTNYNDDHTVEVLTLSEAISKVPTQDRVLGFTMTFLSSGGWVSYQFNGDSITNWTDTNLWISNSSKHNTFVYSNNDIANSVIKELYLYKSGGSINQTLYISQIVKNVNGYYVVITNEDGQNVAALYKQDAPSNNEIVDILDRNSSGIIGKIIVDYSKIDDGAYHMKAVINKIAYSLAANSTIYMKVHDTETKGYIDGKIEEVTTSITNVNEESNKIVYTNDTFFNKHVKELYLYKTDGTSIDKDLFFQNLSKVRKTDQRTYLVIADSDGVTQCAFMSMAGESPNNNTIITLHERNSSGIVGKAVVDFESIASGKEYTSHSLLNKKAFSINFASTVLVRELSTKVDELNESIQSNTENISKLIENDTTQDDRIKDIESSVNAYNYEAASPVITSNKYLSNNGVTEIDLEDFYIASFGVEGYDRVRVTGTFFKLGCALCFKNSDDEIIGNVISTDFTINTTISADVPNGAVTAYTSYREQGREGHSQEVAKRSSRVKDLEDRMQIVTLSEFKDAIGVEYTTEKYLKTDGITEVKADSFTIAKIPVQGIYKVEISGFVSNIMCGLCFRNAQNKVIGEVQHITGSSVWTTFSGEVPEGAVYAYTTYRTFDGHSIKTQIRKIGALEDKVTNNIERIEALEDISPDLDNFVIENVNFIPIFGQSLSVGAAATPIITSKRKYEAGIKFNTGIRCPKKNVSAFTSFVPLVEETSGATNDSAGTGETVASGCVEQLVELLCKEVGISPYSKYWNNHKFLFGSFGAGSTTIAMLTEVPKTGIGYYQGVVNAMQAAKNICDKNGWTLNIPAWIWIQGETDMKPISASGPATDKETYKSALQNLAIQFDTDAKRITGQSNEVKCICYQTASQNIWGNTANYTTTIMDVPTAQMELVRDNDMFVASNPAYVLDHSDSEHIHLSAKGEKMMGLYCGIALKSVIDGSCNKKGVTPATYVISGNTLVIKCNVSCPPLKIDKTWVKEIDNLGFKLLTSENVDIIQSVGVFDDEITISCSQSPLNCKLFYGFNGNPGYDGRLKGSRGNICDFGDRIYNGDIAGKQYSISNYLYTFCCLLSSESGTV